MHDIHIPTPAPLPPVIFTSILTTVLMLHMLLHHLLTIPGTLYTRYIVATFMIIGTIATFGGAQLGKKITTTKHYHKQTNSSNPPKNEVYDR